MVFVQVTEKEKYNYGVVISCAQLGAEKCNGLYAVIVVAVHVRRSEKVKC